MAQETGRSRLMAWNPFRDLTRVQREMEEMLGRLPQWWSERERGSAPAVDMLDNEGEIILRADLPGMDAKDIELTVQDGALTIRGERKEEKEEKKEDYYYSERSYGAFTRTLTLPTGIDRDRVKATFTKGVLEVHLPKAKDAKGTKIEVKAA